MGASGNPAKKPVYASVVTSVEILPENLDLGSYDIPFYPGKLLLDFVDPGARPRIVDHVDGPATFRTEMVRIAIGHAEGDTATFPAAFETIFRLLRNGSTPPPERDEIERAQAYVDAFAQDVADALALAGVSAGIAEGIPDRAKNFVRAQVRRSAAQ